MAVSHAGTSYDLTPSKAYQCATDRCSWPGEESLKQSTSAVHCEIVAAIYDEFCNQDAKGLQFFERLAFFKETNYVSQRFYSLLSLQSMGMLAAEPV